MLALLFHLFFPGFLSFIAFNARRSIFIMHNRAWMRIFLRPLTLWFSRLRCCFSLEMGLSAEVLCL